MSHSDDPIVELQREYLAEVPGMLLLIRSEIDRFRQGDMGAAASLRTRFHRLAGSGGSYGFPAISGVAREIEQWLRTDPAAAEAARMDAAVTRLEEIVEKAAEELDDDGA
jgi:HPt (histidine-containing phosphotransfer) domain-containing protein